MNTLRPTIGVNPLSTPLDRILAEIAFSVQLPPGLHLKATERYKAVRGYLERNALFEDQIEHFYPQGSMAIDATISTRGTDDEYDIDIVAQLGPRFRNKRPHEILDALFVALKGYQGLRVERNSRCVTIYYADGMHLDITPSIRDQNTPDRQSVIAHSKGPGTRPDDAFVPMNAYAFVEWYRERTPIELHIVKDFARRWQMVDGTRIRAEADVDEVPEQTEFVVKNTATLALQLLKRYRNIRYATFDGRIPPSVMLSYFAGATATTNIGLADMLIRLAHCIAAEIRAAGARWVLLDVCNPEYDDDVFTDRWPKDFITQAQFARHLEDLVEGLQAAKAGRTPAWKLNEWLREMFGDHVVTAAATRIAAETGAAIQGTRQSYTTKGGLVLPATAGLAVPSVARAAAPAVPHHFYGRKMK